MSLLVYSRTAGYRHESIPTAQGVLRSMYGGNISISNGSNTTRIAFSEDPSVFNSTASLAQYTAIAFLSNSDEILDTPNQKYNLDSYLIGGGGLVGIHSGSAALFATPFFGTALGAFFDYHPALQPATFVPTNASHPSTSGLPPRWTYEEEVYNFRQDPRTTNVTLLLTVDPDSYTDDNKARANAIQGLPHPIAWCREGGLDLGNGTGTNGMNATNGTVVQRGTFNMPGRMWYTALGHTNEIWQNATFQAHIKGGIDWVLAGAVVNRSNTSAVLPVSTGGSGIGGNANKPSSAARAASRTGSFSIATIATVSMLLLGLMKT